MRRVLLLFVLGGCNIMVKVPPAYKGDLHITFTNRLDHDLCEFGMVPRGVTGPVGNWLHTADVGPGSGRGFDIRPGDYRVEVGCGQAFHGSAMVHLTGPTELVIGIAADRRQFARTNPFIPVHGMVGRYVAPVQNYAPAGGEEESPPEQAAEEAPAASSSSSSSSSEAPAASGPSCMPHGAAGCDDSHFCCPGTTCASRTKYSDGSLGFGYCQ